MKKILIVLIPTLLVIGIFYVCFNNMPSVNTQIPEETITVEEEIEEIQEEIVIEEEKPLYNEPNIDQFHSKLIDIALENDVYGMQVVVFKGEEILHSFNYGYSDIKEKTEVNDSTVFRIASTSKMISNMLIMKLVDDGLIELGSNLNEVTGLNFKEGIKLYHILTHTSGISDSKEFDEGMNKVLDINHLLDISCVGEPGKDYRYTNFGAGTMAAIVESVTGEYFMDYAQRELFDYLDLNAGYVCEYLDEGTDVAKMYDDVVYDPSTWMYNYDFYRSFELGKQYRLAYGNMYISASDLAKLGMVLAGDGTLNGKRVLSTNALREIKFIRNEAEGYKYRAGLNTDEFKDLVEGRTIYGHTGSAYNAISYLMYDPSDNTGVVLLTNHSLNKKNDSNYTKVIYDTVNLAYKEFFTKYEE